MVTYGDDRDTWDGAGEESQDDEDEGSRGVEENQSYGDFRLRQRWKLVALVVIAGNRHVKLSSWSHRSIINPRPQPKSILKASRRESPYDSLSKVIRQRLAVRVLGCCTDSCFWCQRNPVTQRAAKPCPVKPILNSKQFSTSAVGIPASKLQPGSTFMGRPMRTNSANQR